MRSMRGAVQGQDTSVRGIICKGRFVQGSQHPRTFGRGHIGRGHINPASKYLLPHHTLFQFICPQIAHQAGKLSRQSCWVACLWLKLLIHDDVCLLYYLHFILWLRISGSDKRIFLPTWTLCRTANFGILLLRRQYTVRCINAFTILIYIITLYIFSMYERTWYSASHSI